MRFSSRIKLKRSIQFGRRTKNIANQVKSKLFAEEGETAVPANAVGETPSKVAGFDLGYPTRQQKKRMIIMSRLGNRQIEKTPYKKLDKK